MPVEISDGGATPHATDYSDLLDKLRTFALATGFWTSLQHDSVMTCLQGEGAGSDEIVVAFQKYSDVPSDTYGWYVNGYSGYTNGLSFTAQPGALPNWTSSSNVPAHPAIPLWNASIPYWFIVNERRIIVIAKVSTTFHCCYAGWFLPFASPGQFPYPMVVGGSAGLTAASNKPRFSLTTVQASAFWGGRSQSGSSSPSLNLRSTDGSWVGIANSFSLGSSGFDNAAQNGVYPYYLDDVDTLTQAMDGSAVLTPAMICRSGSTGIRGLLGEFDGIFHVSGDTHGAEDIITIGADDYLVVQDIFRTAVENYCAVKLD